MYQKFIFIFFIISFQNIANAQTDTCYEQIALDYFTKHLLDTSDKKIKYHIFNGYVRKLSSATYNYCDRLDSDYQYNTGIICIGKLYIPTIFTEKINFRKKLFTSASEKSSTSVLRHYHKEDKVIVVIIFYTLERDLFHTIYIDRTTLEVTDTCKYSRNY